MIYPVDSAIQRLNNWGQVVSRWRGVNISTAEWIFVNYAVEMYDFALNLFRKLSKNKVCRILKEKNSLIPLISVFWWILFVITCILFASRHRIALFNASIMKSTEGKTRSSPKILRGADMHSCDILIKYWELLQNTRPRYLNTVTLL